MSDTDLSVHDFNFELPEELIAQYPPEDRAASRLMTLEGQTGLCGHRVFRDLPELLQPGDLLVFNNTQVIPARLFGRKASGGKVEMLFERLLDDRRCLAHVRSNRSPAEGSVLIFADQVAVRVCGRQDRLFILELTDEASPGWFAVLEEHGHIPLPPYMHREDDEEDRSRYQTVYARHKGAVAAPTAGLHFDEALLETLKNRGVNIAWVTLHVGSGTFLPVQVDQISEHVMHSEWYELPEETVAAIHRTREQGGRVIAVGTTSVRTLESAAQVSELLRPCSGDTDIFIYPGYRFKVVDALVTNFHLPESTLIMLISAFAGREHVMAAYEQAVRERYRFFSYGDAMFITPQLQESSE